VFPPCPIDAGLFEQARLGIVPREQLRLAIGDLRESALKDFGDARMQRSPRVAQQCA
jgi:hypothetical protein